MTPQELAAIKWTRLPQGQDVVIRKGFLYAALASVSKSYSSGQIQSAARNKGLVIEQWDEQGVAGSPLKDPNPDHRFIHVIALAANDAGTLPWKSPWPTTIFNLEKAWYSAPGGGGNGAPSVAPPTNWLGWGIAASLAAAAYGGWRLYKRRRRR